MIFSPVNPSVPFRSIPSLSINTISLSLSSLKSPLKQFSPLEKSSREEKRSKESKMLRLSCRKFLGFAQQQQQPRNEAQALVRFYHERVVDHYNNPRNVGSFDKNDPTVGTGLVGAPACGDVMKLQIKIDDESGKIVDACFKTFGCGSAIASSSVATEWVKGKQMEEVLTIKNTEIAKHLSLPPVKLHCSMLAEDAIKAAVKDYEAKRAKSGSNTTKAAAVDGASAEA